MIMSALSLKTETPRVIPTQPLFSVNSLSKQPATEERPALHNPLGGTPAHPRKLKHSRDTEPGLSGLGIPRGD